MPIQVFVDDVWTGLPNGTVVGPGQVIGTNAFSTIQGGVNVADPFGTVQVAPGTYNETVIVNKTLQLHGAEYGIDARTRNTTPAQESIVTGGGISAQADRVVIDGFTVQSVLTGPGIATSPAFSGYWIFNNIIQNNVFGLYLNSNVNLYSQVKRNFLRNNTQPGAASGNGIYSDQGAHNILISENRLTGHDPINSAGINFGAVTSDSNLVMINNELNNDSSIALTNTTNVKIADNTLLNIPATAIFFGGGTNLTDIEDNVIENNSRAIFATNFFSGTANSNIRAKHNSIQNNGTGLQLSAAGYTPATVLDATNNWWGNPSGPSGIGPGTGDSIIDPLGVVIFDPWLLANPFGPTPVDRIVNGGFETGSFPPWVPFNATIDSAHSHTGNFSAQLSGDTANAYIYQVVTVNPGEQDQLSLFLSKLGAAPSPPVTIEVLYYDASFHFIESGLVINVPANSLPDIATNTWLNVSGTTSPAPANAASALVLINKLPMGGSPPVLVDDVSMLVL